MKSFCIVLSILFLFLLVSPCESSLEAFAEDSSELKQYEHKSTGLKFTYPGNLIELKEIPDDIVVQFQSPDYAINYVFQYLPVKVSLSEMIDFEVEQLKLGFSNFKLEESSLIDIGNDKGGKIVYTTDDLGFPLKIMQIVVIKNEAEYIVSFLAPTEKFSENSEVFERVIESISIKDQEIPISLYEDSNHKYKIEYPSNWQKYDVSSEGNDMVAFISPFKNTEDTFPEEVNIVVTSGATGYTMEKLVDEIEQGYPRHPDLKNFKLLESKPIELKGIPAQEMVFTARIVYPYIDSSGMPVFGDHPILKLVNTAFGQEVDAKIMQTFFLKDDTMYVITYRGSPNDFDSFLPEARKVMDSFYLEGMSKGTTSGIPDWIRNNAQWWSQGAIGDSDFVSGIQYLIKEEIMKIPETTKTNESSSKEIPSWIKNNADWWSQGLITDDDFLKGIQYLVENGIIVV